MQKSNVRFIGSLLIFLMMATVLCGCKENTADKSGTKIKTASAAEFASYKEVAVKDNAVVKPYVVAPDLSNVVNANRFEFSSATRDLLVKNGFAVLPMRNFEFFSAYEINRYDYIPNFITTDSMLHNYHLYFSHLLESIEGNKLAPELKELNRGMLADSLAQYQALQGTAWENAARRNLAFFTVGSILLDSNIKPHEAVAS